MYRINEYLMNAMTKMTNRIKYNQVIEVFLIGVVVINIPIMKFNIGTHTAADKQNDS